MKKTFPEFLATPIKNNPGAKKIFPVIGLKDKSVKLKVNKGLLALNFRTELLHYLAAFLTQDRYQRLTQNDKEFIQLAQQVYTELNNHFVFSKELKKKLSLLRKLNKTFIKTKRIWWLEETFKTYHHLSKSNLKICFSTKQWDLATISMRGVKSCQSWGNTTHSRYLQGTVLDPFVGELYTNGKKTSYGSKMLFRALVRYTFALNNIPELFMELIYHSSNYMSNRPIYNCLGYYSDYFYRAGGRKNNFMLIDVFKSFFEKYLPNSKVAYGLVSGDGNNYIVPRSVYEWNISASLSDAGVYKNNLPKHQLNSFPNLAPEVKDFLKEVLLN